MFKPPSACFVNPFHVCLYPTVLFVPCSLVVTCWESVILLALLFVMFSCVFFTFPFDVLGQVCYLIALIPDLCLLPYFVLLNVVFVEESSQMQILNIVFLYLLNLSTF